MDDNNRPQGPRNDRKDGPIEARKVEKPGSGPGARPPNRILTWVAVIFVFMALLVLLNESNPRAREISLSELKRTAAYVEKIQVRDSKITGQYSPDAHTNNILQTTDSLNFMVRINPGMQPLVLEMMLAEAPAAVIGYEPEFEFGSILQWIFLLMLIVFGVVIFVSLFRQFRGGGGGGFLSSFSRSKHKMLTREQTQVTFADVAGIEEPKQEVMEIVEFLKSPARFGRLGGRVPRGVLLVGQPGCGKTLLAKAIAGEADVPFFSISGSDFVEMFVGVGASRVRDLFSQAKQNAPCIIFLDEIDAVGRRRGTGFSSGGHDEREQTLNAILVEMDGFETNDGVIVVAATNRVDVLDPALTRPGRFDRQVVVPPPDVKGRAEILQVHARKVQLSPDVDMSRLARGTSGFSGADLAAIINEAAIIATMGDKDAVGMDDLEEARDKIRFGRLRRSRVRDEAENRMTAYHEAGHAVIQVLQPDEDPLHKVTILPRGNMGGAAMSLPEKDRMTMHRRFALARLRTAMGGRLGEELFCDDISSGAQADIAMATQLARAMVTEWGMSERLGMIRVAGTDGGDMFGLGSRDTSEATAALVDTEVKRILDDAFADARRMLLENRDFVERLVKALLKHETLDGAAVLRIRDGESLEKPTAMDLVAGELARKPRTEAGSPTVGGGLDGLLPQPAPGG